MKSQLLSVFVFAAPLLVQLFSTETTADPDVAKTVEPAPIRSDSTVPIVKPDAAAAAKSAK